MRVMQINANIQQIRFKHEKHKKLIRFDLLYLDCGLYNGWNSFKASPVLTAMSGN